MKRLKAGELVIFLKEDNKVGVLLKRRVWSDGDVFWKVLMQTGSQHNRIRRILELNLRNGRNSRYKIISSR